MSARSICEMALFLERSSVSGFLASGIPRFNQNLCRFSFPFLFPFFLYQSSESRLIPSSPIFRERESLVGCYLAVGVLDTTKSMEHINTPPLMYIILRRAELRVTRRPACSMSLVKHGHGGLPERRRTLFFLLSRWIESVVV